MTKPFVPCLIVSKRWFLIGLLFQLPFFTVPSKPGHGIRLDLTKVDDRGLLAAASRVRLAAVTAPSASMMWSGGAGTSTATATAAVHASRATNLVDLRIGTPSPALTALLYTGSNGA